MRRVSSIGPLSLRPSWCVSRLISSWYQEGPYGSGRPRMRPRRFPSLCWARGPILLRKASLKALRVPVGNITGLTLLGGELGGKRLELLKEAVPKLARVAVLYNPAVPVGLFQVKEVLPDAARALGLTFQPWEVRATDDFERVLAAISKWRADGLYGAGGALANADRKRITGFALKNRLPSIGGSREFVNAGGLMTYGADQEESYRRVAYYVDKILKGTKPADLPVERPTKF